MPRDRRTVRKGQLSAAQPNALIARFQHAEGRSNVRFTRDDEYARYCRVLPPKTD